MKALIQSGKAPADADHHAHDSADGHPPGLRHLRPQGGSRHQGNAQTVARRFLLYGGDVAQLPVKLMNRRIV